MDIILYNPLSRNGRNQKIVKRLLKKLSKKNINAEVYSLLEIDDVDGFIKKLLPTQRVIIVGGDGTIHRLANRIYNMKYTQSIYLYSAGTGNDFARSISRRKKLIDIKPYLQRLPIVSFNNQEKRFVNGVGLGLDGMVCYNVNTSRGKKNKLNYFKQAFKAFRKAKKMQVNISVDHHQMDIKDAWMVSVMNAPYFGGGMKVAPKAKRLDHSLQLVVIKKAPKWLLFLIFPTIYLGIHRIFKRYVRIYKGTDIKVEFDNDVYMQTDGEHEYPIKDIHVKSE